MPTDDLGEVGWVYVSVCMRMRVHVCVCVYVRVCLDKDPTNVLNIVSKSRTADGPSAVETTKEVFMYHDEHLNLIK